MAKVLSKKPKPAKSQVAGRRQRIRLKAPRAPGLSKEALDYARQLVDPCGAPLRSPPYGGGEGTMMARCRGRLLVNSGSEANEHHGVIFYHPTLGAYVASTTDATAVQQFLPAPGLVNIPLSATASTSGMPRRGVAACAQVRFLGPELYRLGKIAAGIVPGQHVWSCLAWQQGGGAQGVVVDTTISMLETSCRMPQDTFEVNWTPGAFDEEFHEAQYWQLTTGDVSNKAITQSLENIYSRANFLCIAWTGLMASQSPVEIVTTSIVETIFDVNTAGTTNFPGQVIVSSAKRNPGGGAGFVNSVIAYLQSKDPRWYINSTMKAMSLLSTGPTKLLTAAMAGLTVNPPTSNFRLTY